MDIFYNDYIIDNLLSTIKQHYGDSSYQYCPIPVSLIRILMKFMMI